MPEKMPERETAFNCFTCPKVLLPPGSVVVPAALLDIVQEALEYMCRLEAGQEHAKVMTCYPDDCVEPCGYWEECTYRRQMNALIALRNFREGESDG